MKESDIILYTDPKEHVRVEVHYAEETFWLSQRRMAELFGKDVRTINEHLKNSYESGELEAASTIRKFRIVQTEGKARSGARGGFLSPRCRHSRGTPGKQLRGYPVSGLQNEYEST